MRKFSNIDPAELLDELATMWARYRRTEHVGELAQLNRAARSLLPLLHADGQQDLAVRLTEACLAHNLDRKGGDIAFVGCLRELQDYFARSV